MSVRSPRSLDEALSALAGTPKPARLLAGGTDLMVEFQTGRTPKDNVIDLWALDELRGVRREAGGVRLGALTTCAELLASEIVAAELDVLRLAADEVGAEQIKNRATIGGNLGTASPAADLNPVLLALGASVRLRSVRGARDVPIDAFFTGYRATARADTELIDSVWIADRPADERRAFRKIGTRRAQSISKVVVALAVRRRGAVLDGLRAAAGSVADRTVLLPTLHAQLAGRELTTASIDAAARAAARSDIAPIDDVRSTGAYRRWVLYRTLVGLLSQTCESLA